MALPDEETFHTALRRAGTVFGQSVSPVLYARNVAKLAGKVREVAEAHRVALAEARTLLRTHASRLDLAGPGGADAPRMRSMKAAADLVARLLRAGDSTGLTTELATVTYEVADDEIGAALKQAPEVLEALRATDWTLLDTVRELAGREDGVGERARWQLDAVREAAGSHERYVSLVPVLGSLHDTAMALMREATRLAQAARPVVPPTAEPPAGSHTDPDPAARPGADDVSLTDHGTPPVPSASPAATAPAEPSAPAAHARQLSGPGASYLVEPTRPGTGPADALAHTLTDMGAEIRAFLAARPGSRVQVSWQAVGGDGTDGTNGTGSGGGETGR